MAKATVEEAPVTEAPATDEGIGALIRTLPEFDIVSYTEDGDEVTTHYKMRPLGLKDAFKILRVISAGSVSMAQMQKEGLLRDGQGIMYAILGSIPLAEFEVKQLLANVLTHEVAGKPKPLSINEFDDLPIDAVIPIIEAIGSHPDLTSLLKNARGLAKTPLFSQMQQEIKDSQPNQTTN